MSKKYNTSQTKDTEKQHNNGEQDNFTYSLPKEDLYQDSQSLSMGLQYGILQLSSDDYLFSVQRIQQEKQPFLIDRRQDNPNQQITPKQSQMILRSKMIGERCANITKFISKLFLKNLDGYQNDYKQDRTNFQMTVIQAEKLKQKLRQDKNYYISLTMLQNLLGICPNNRKTMRSIIKQHMREDVLNNSQIGNKINYLNTLKVYALRCLNLSLTSRIESK